ncbi:MAG: hypothetical protein WC197_08830 [Candidatus Gastranaerophilaceae bacterium]
MSKQEYIENHLETIKEYYQEGMKYFKWIEKDLEIISKINKSKTDNNLHLL